MAMLLNDECLVLHGINIVAELKLHEVHLDGACR